MRPLTFVRNRVHAFFRAESDPLNLAVLRIATFAWLLLVLLRGDFVRYAYIPAELRVAPQGYDAFFHLIPWQPATVRVVHAVAILACAAALLGLASRAASLIACAALVYLLGLPEFFGKIDHVHHHFIWITALLAASRCGDALSVDAVRAALRRADHDRATEPPPPSIAYTLPLRIVWLLIGVAYFFPGLAKLRVGPQWVFSDNLKYLMHRFWTAKDFVPVLRIDRYPLVYRSAAAATVIFEVGFLPALFVPRLRRLFVAGGVLFHLLTHVYLGIGFYGLLACYVAFVDWAAVLAAMARRVFRTPLVIAYDGGDRSSRRVVAGLRSVDVLRAIDWWDSSARGEPQRSASAAALNSGARYVLVSPEAPHASLTRADVVARLPMALPLLPLLRWLAAGSAAPGAHAQQVRLRSPAPALTIAVGGLLLSINVLCGALAFDSWPFGVYPRFAGKNAPILTELEVVVRDRAGHERRVDTGLRAVTLERLLSSNASDGGTRVAALAQYMAEHRVALAAGESLQVLEVTRSTAPEDRGREPLRRRLVSQFGPIP